MANSNIWQKIDNLGYVQQGAHTLVKKALKNPQFDAKHDLHGLNANEAHTEITSLLENAWDLQQRQLLIIHGIGAQVIRKIVWDYCIEHPYLLAVTKAPDNLGGLGATVLIFKRRVI